MNCWVCNLAGHGACRFCGRCVCRDHVRPMPYVLGLFEGADGLEGLAVDDAVFCGVCRPHPEPLAMEFLRGGRGPGRPVVFPRVGGGTARDGGAAVNKRSTDFPITPTLLAVSAVEALVLAFSGAGAFLAPGVTKRVWPWQIAPFNSRFSGAIYLTALVVVAALLATRRWSPARVALPMIAAFTVVVLAVSVASLDRFETADRPAAVAAWFVLYALLPVNAFVHLYRWRGRPVAEPVFLPEAWASGVRTAGVGMFGYGVALLVAPLWSTGFWPWGIDSFHGRLYASTFVAGGIGLWMVAKNASKLEVMLVAFMQVVLSVLAVAGVVWTDAETNRVDWSRPGTWAWVAMWAVSAVAALALVRKVRPLGEPPRWTVEVGRALVSQPS